MLSTMLFLRNLRAISYLMSRVGEARAGVIAIWAKLFPTSYLLKGFKVGSGNYDWLEIIYHRIASAASRCGRINLDATICCVAIAYEVKRPITKSP
jgi:hypothetical protein